MKSKRETKTAQNRGTDDNKAPIQKSRGAIWVAIFILLILAGLGYLLFSTLPLEEEGNRQRLLVSALALMLLVVGLLVFVQGWFKKTTRKKGKAKRKPSRYSPAPKSVKRGKKTGRR